MIYQLKVDYIVLMMKILNDIFLAYLNLLIFIAENESTYIPAGIVHALENPGKVDLELIEVQSGSYFGEDDIVRIDDIYGRS